MYPAWCLLYTNSYANAQNVNMRNISRKPSWQNASFSKRVLVPILSYQNAISSPTLTHFDMNACAATSYPGHFPWERGCLCSRPYFDRQITGNSEMVYYFCSFHLPQLSEPSNGFYQSVDDITESEKQNNNKGKQGTPQDKENGPEDTSETESKSRPMSSFKNPAYQSTSMNSGLDSETPL